MSALVVPTIFTAVDKITGVVDRMKRSVGGFAGKASIGLNALSNGMNKILPSFRGMAGQLLSMAKTIAIFGLASFSLKTILDYEKSLAHLHGILNNLSAGAFVPFRMEVNKVAKETQTSASIVADAFTKIAERNIDLAKTPESLAHVTRAAITLGRAADMELVPSIEGLVNLLYQFNLQGKDAGRVVNVLAAGKKFGSSNIEEQIEAYKKFGSVAKHANLSLEQSQALIQTVAHTAKGEEAGVGLRNIILYLQKYKQAYDKNGKFDMGVALQATADHLHKLGTQQKQNIFLQELFGKRTANVALTLLDGIDRYKQLTAAVTNTTEAEKQAAINQDNVSDVFKRMVATYQNYITSNENTMPGLQRLKDILRYITKNMDGIIDGVITFVKWFLILKGVIWACQIALGAYNIAMGIMGAVTGIANIAIGESSIALGAYRLALLLGLGPTTAMSAATTTLGASATTAAAGLGTAEVAATSLMATLGGFVVPAALLTLAGLGIWKGFKKDVTFAHGTIVSMTPQPNLTPAQQAESDRLKALKDKVPGFRPFGQPETPDNGAPVESFPALPKVPNVAPTKYDEEPGTKGELSITVHDPNQVIKDIKPTGLIPINVKVTSTTGQN